MFTFTASLIGLWLLCRLLIAIAITLGETRN